MQVFVVPNDVVVEPSRPDSSMWAEQFATLRGEEAVHLAHYRADRGHLLQRQQDVIVVGHDDVGVERDAAAISFGDVELDEQLGEVRVFEITPALIEVAAEEVCATGEVEPREATVEHDGLFVGQELVSCHFEREEREAEAHHGSNPNGMAGDKLLPNVRAPTPSVRLEPPHVS